MFIKQVKISGFKAYGETTVFGEFSPKKNCIYGLNGSGKSSFLSAIEFVFLDEYSHLRPSDRQSLLYSGKILSNTPTAYVEITFDNTAQRLPIKDNEVSVRRSIGINKDEYFIQRKHSTRQDVINLFDSANYSMGSGLFSVKQGRVKTIAEMTDADRIELIFEISGMRSYDEQRRESLTMLAQAEKRREKIDEAIIEIGNKLTQIQQEKQELEEYEKVIRIKKAIEYIICEEEREKVEAKLSDNEINIANESSVVNSLQIEREEVESARASLEQELKSIENQIQQNEQDSKISEQKWLDLVKKQARSDCDLEKYQRDTENAKILLIKLQAKREELIETLENLNHKSQICKSECDELNSAKIRLDSILNYNQSLKKAMDDLYQIEQLIETTENKIESYQNDNRDILEKLNSRKSKAESIIDQKTEEKRIVIEEDENNQSERIKGFNEKKSLYKKQFEYQKYKQNQELVYQKSISEYEHMMGETSEAIKFIRSNFDENDGFYGQLIDLIEFDENLNAAVDSAAGRRLFYVVVETDDLAIRILNSLKENGIYGQVNFFLLNRINATRKKIEKTPNSEPLIDLIQFDQRAESAVEFVFGSIALCSTIKIATEIAETKNVTCVTLSGDTAHYSGVITGGYISSKRSISRAKRNIEKAKEPLDKAIEKLNEINQKIDQVDVRLRQIEKDIQNNENRIPKINKEIIDAQSELDESVKAIKRIDNELENLNNNLAELQEQKQNLEKTIDLQKQEDPSSLSTSAEDRDNDQRKLSEISSELAKKNIEYKQINFDCNKFSKQIESLDKKIDELQQDKIEKLKSKAEREKKEIQDAIDSFNEENEEIKETRKDLQNKLEEVQTNLNDAKTNERDCHKKLSYEASRLEELNRSKTILTSKKEEILKNIANIGPLPLAEIEGFKEDFGSERKFKYDELKKVNSQLQSFRFVNKKAIEQFKQFEKQGIDLKERQEDINNSIDAIRKLLAQLDKNKEKAVTRTCSLVSSNFSRIYQKLDPSRNASLILTTQEDTNSEFVGIEIADDEYDENKSENEDSNDDIESHHKTNNPLKRNNVLNLTGMAISVNGEKIDGMSGGEKTLVAIALLFAIQLTESNPFYLLDEIDSDLDVNARQALAKMIDEMAEDVDLSKQVQFIYTTHRSEMMEHADKFFAIKHTNDSSIVKETDYENAMAFINDIHEDNLV